jgi:hypothetical protein
MVEQTQASLPGPLTVPRRPQPAAPVQLAEPALTAPRLLLVVVACLLIPGNFAFAGIQLSPNRMLLLALLPFLGWRWLRGDAGGPNLADILMLFSTLWMMSALIVNHGLAYVTRGAVFGVELFGGYLVGRMLIRSTADYRWFFTLLTVGFVCLMPFAVVEMLTGKNLIRPLFDPVFNIPPRQSNLGHRLGMVRAQTVFEHPILFGLTGSMAVANMLYIYRDRFLRSLRLTAFFVFMVFTTISSGPMLSVGLQLAMTAWDRLLWVLRGKWFILAGSSALVLAVLYFAAEFHLLDFVIEHLMFASNTADGRLIILEYGTAEVLRHPLFGIGLSDWVRPFYKKPSFDNYWLGLAMRYGIPTLLLMVAAIAVNCSRIAMQSTLTPREASYRTGYLITLAGLTITLGTVYIWGATSVFIGIYLGAGAWLYMNDAAERTDDGTVRARRAAQARGFAAAPAPALPVSRPAPRRTAADGGRSAAAPAARSANGSRARGRPGDDRNV